MRVLSAVERGWRGARECSLVLAERGLTVTHLIRGVLGPDVRAIIQPHPRIRLIDMPRMLYVVVLWVSVVLGGMVRRIRWVLVDNGRLLHRLQWCAGPLGITVLLVREGNRGYDLVVGDRLVAVDDLVGAVGRSAT